MTGPTSELKIVGDVDGRFTGDAGLVRLTGFLTADNVVANNTASTMNLNGRNFITFENIIFDGLYNPVVAMTSNPANTTFRNCMFINQLGGDLIFMQNGFGSPTSMNHLVERCTFLNSSSGGVSLRIQAVKSTTAEYNINIKISNNVFIGFPTNSITLEPQGANTFAPGGGEIYNNFFLGGNDTILVSSSGWSTTTPAKVYNNVFFCGANAVHAQTVGQVLEDYNIFTNATARTSTTAGTNSKNDGSLAFATMEFLQSWQYGFNPKPFGSPWPNSPFLGFGGNASYLPTYDFLARNRPEGANSTSNGVGAMEAHNTALQTASIARSGTYSGQLIGPGSQDIQLPIDSGSSTISIYMYYESTYGGLNKPQAILTGGGEAGISDQTLVMTAANQTWEQKTFSVTASKNTVVTLRITNRSTAVNGTVYFDDLSIY